MTKTYVDKKLVDESAKDITPVPDWLMWFIGTLFFIIGSWVMVAGGLFRW